MGSQWLKLGMSCQGMHRLSLQAREAARSKPLICSAPVPSGSKHSGTVSLQAAAKKPETFGLPITVIVRSPGFFLKDFGSDPLKSQSTMMIKGSASNDWTQRRSPHCNPAMSMGGFRLFVRCHQHHASLEHDTAKV